MWQVVSSVSGLTCAPGVKKIFFSSFFSCRCRSFVCKFHFDINSLFVFTSFQGSKIHINFRLLNIRILRPLRCHFTAVFFADSVARAMIACQTFAYDHTVPPLYKPTSNPMCLSLGPKNTTKKLDKQPVKEFWFSVIKLLSHMRCMVSNAWAVIPRSGGGTWGVGC